MLSQSFELTIRQLCEDILSEPIPEALPGKIIDHMQATFPVEWSTLWVTEQKGVGGAKRLRLAAAAGPATKLLATEQGAPAVYDFGEGLTGEIAARRKTINITKPKDFRLYHTVRKYDRVMYGRSEAGELCRCVLGVPLLLKSTSATGLSDADDWRVIGVLKLENVRQTERHPEPYFTQRDQEIVEGYAAVIAVALEKAQMRADSVRIGQGLLEVSASLLAKLGERPNLDEIVRQTANVISAEACALWLRSGLELRLEAAHGYPGENRDVPPYHLEVATGPEGEGPGTSSDQSKPETERYCRAGLTVFVANTTRPVNLKTFEEVRSHFAWRGAHDGRMWNKPPGEACYSLVAIPLVDNETKDLKGVFKVENKRPTIFQLQSYFTDEDQQLLTTLGNSISLSLIISERIERLRRLEHLVSNVRVLDGPDVALFFILTGLTHGGGLQYNRAMVFLKDERDPGRLVCPFAIGPIEREEWHREMQSGSARPDLNIDGLLREFHADKGKFYGNPMTKRWGGCQLFLHDGKRQIIARHAATRRDTAKYLSGDLQPGDVLHGFASGDFVLIPIYVEKNLEGVIYADNRFTGNRVNQFECEVLDLFAGMAGAILQGSRVPEKLRQERDQAWRSFSGVAAHRLGAEAGIIDNEVVQYIQPELGQAPSDPEGRLRVRGDVIEGSLKVIRQSVNRLRNAVRDYQQLSWEPEPPERFDLCDLIEATVRETTGNLKSIVVETRYDRRPIRIGARRRRLTYLFEELLLNAWKEVDAGDRASGARGPAEIKVLIDVRQERGQIKCIVSDNGPGIPHKLHGTLFKMHGKGRRGGTGLGLFIIGQILRDNGGSIDELTEGKPEGYNGACFRITLPVDVSAG